MCDIFSKVLYNQRRTKARCRKDCALSCTPILCWQLLVSILTVWRGQVFSTLVSLGDWTRVEFLGNIQACLQTHRSRRKCTVNVRQFCKHWDTNSQQCWGSIIIICFETKLQNKDERFYLLLKGRWQRCVAVVRIRKCEELLFPFPWNSIFRSGRTHNLWDGWLTPSLRRLAYTISEWDSKSHSQGIHFTRSHIFGGKYFWRTDFSIAVSVAFSLKQYFYNSLE